MTRRIPARPRRRVSGATPNKPARPRSGASRDELINSRHVRYFLAVCRYGSLTGAARACGITQSAMTLAVGRMERAVGGRLFERGRSTSLTPLAVELLPLFERAQNALDKITTFLERRPR